MPLFTFECEDCEESFEELLRISQSEKEVRCPQCGSSRIRKKLSHVAKMSSSSSSSFAAPIPTPSCAPGGT